jgi:ribose 5-phosphate isomerase B
MRVAIGSDHAGFALKQTLGSWLRQRGHIVTDVGTHDDERTDYPVFGARVAELVAAGEVDAGVAVCGSGQGICMAANKIAGVRAGVIREVQDAVMVRRHNDANVACFGERVTEASLAEAALEAFLTTEFDGGRHQTRVDQLASLDEDLPIEPASS